MFYYETLLENTCPSGVSNCAKASVNAGDQVIIFWRPGARDFLQWMLNECRYPLKLGIISNSFMSEDLWMIEGLGTTRSLGICLFESSWCSRLCVGVYSFRAFQIAGRTFAKSSAVSWKRWVGDLLDMHPVGLLSGSTTYTCLDMSTWTTSRLSLDGSKRHAGIPLWRIPARKKTSPYLS